MDHGGEVDHLPNASIASDAPTHRGRGHSTTTTTTTTTEMPYFIPRRPRVVKMRDLSPATRDQMVREYFDAYDPWTGVRIAATLGILISLFTLFLIYKGRFAHRRHQMPPPTRKETSLYLYDDMDLADCDLASLSSSGCRSAYGLSFAYRNHPDDRFRCLEDEFQLEEVYVKPSVVSVKVKRPQKPPKVAGTLRVNPEDTSKSLPCSPYKPHEDDTTEVKEVVSSPGHESLEGSIASFGSVDLELTEVKRDPGVLPRGKGESSLSSSPNPRAVVVTAKKPQDYRSRSTIVSIARRQRRTS